MTKSDRALLTMLWTLYGFLIVFVVAGSTADIIFSVAKLGINQEWLGFIGSIIGGLITAGAGVAAWFAAQRTMRATQLVAERKELATYQVIQRELVPRVEMLVRYWRVVQRASRGNSDVKHRGVVLVKSIGEHGITETWLDEIRRLGSDLSPIKRRELVDVLQGFQLILGQLKRELDQEDRRAAHFWLLGLRTMLSHFERYLRAFDRELAGRFDGFTKSDIDHRNLAEHIDPLIQTFEDTGDIA